jgi:hypothetical protein
MFSPLEKCYWTTQTSENVKLLMEQLEEYFKNEFKNSSKSSSGLWKKLRMNSKNEGIYNILYTPVPTLRVKFELNGRKVLCDLTFSNGLGVENSKIMNHLFELQPEAFKLYHFVRIWIHIDVFNFKRYVVALMVIFYLQTKNLMPSVVELQKDVPEKFIDGEFIETIKVFFFQKYLNFFVRLERELQ